MPVSDPDRQRRVLRRRFAAAVTLATAAATAVFAALTAIAESGSEAEIVAIISAAILALIAAGGLAWLAADRVLMKPLGEMTAEIRFLAESARDTEIAAGRYSAFAPLPQFINELARRASEARRDIDRTVTAATRRADEQKRLLESILRDLSEGVVVCSLDHRILLYNQVALTLIDPRGELGLGRSLFAFLTDEPIRHTIDRLTHREASDEPSVPLVCATVDSRALLRGRMTLLATAEGGPTGYILTVADVTHEIDELDRRDRLLRAATDGLRAPLANLRAAAETLAAYPDIDAAQRRGFEQVILRETEALGQRLEETDRDSRELTASHWPLADIHSVDLLNCVIRRLADSDGPAVTMVGLPLWLQGDSHSLVVALERLLRNLSAVTGRSQFDIEALLGDRRVYVEMSWDGVPVPAATIDSWLTAPLEGALGARTLGDVLTRHGSDIWSRTIQPQAGATGRAVLRLPLPSPGRIQFRTPVMPQSPRPEFYDFDLMRLAPAERGFTDRPLRGVPYVVFDTETTGLNPSRGDEIISIGAVRVVNGRILTGETFSRLVNPGRPIPPESMRFHNISDAMVQDAPPIAVVLPQFRTFVGDAILVAHNAAFDLKFIRLKEGGGSRFDMMALDTMLISMFLYPEIASHDLDSIAERLGVEIAGRHSALGDALATAAVFSRLIDMLEARGVTTLGALARASNMTLDIRMRQEQF